MQAPLLKDLKDPAFRAMLDSPTSSSILTPWLDSHRPPIWWPAALEWGLAWSMWLWHGFDFSLEEDEGGGERINVQCGNGDGVPTPARPGRGTIYLNGRDAVLRPNSRRVRARGLQLQGTYWSILKRYSLLDTVRWEEYGGCSSLKTGGRVEFRSQASDPVSHFVLWHEAG